MGRLFLVSLAPTGTIYCCKHCDTPLAYAHQIVSKMFCCKHGKAYLFDKREREHRGEGRPDDDHRPAHRLRHLLRRLRVHPRMEIRTNNRFLLLLLFFSTFSSKCSSLTGWATNHSVHGQCSCLHSRRTRGTRRASSSSRGARYARAALPTESSCGLSMTSG